MSYNNNFDRAQADYDAMLPDDYWHESCYCDECGWEVEDEGHSTTCSMYYDSDESEVD